MKTIDTQVLFQPDSAELKFLPEGPYTLDADRISWVGIQHGAESSVGSINILDHTTGQNQSHELPGRPGFAFPTNQPGVFVAGAEQTVGLFNTASGEWTPMVDNVEQSVEGTVINDGLTFDGNLLFGCKDLNFQDKKAGLYLWRRSDQSLHQLRADQICSNGKAVRSKTGSTYRILDIDTPTKQVVEFELNLETASITSTKVAVDLNHLDMFPDGMILTPDASGVIIAFYNPNDADFGEAHQYNLETGELETVWRCAKAPQVTCPQLVSVGDAVKLVLTTAVEHMPVERQAVHTNSGCLFVGETEFSSVSDQPVFDVPAW